MTKKPGPGICVHCLEHASKRNWDHVFPRGWYPDTTPNNLEKWKIPTCKPCNNSYGKLEDEMGIILSACVDPTSSSASGIWRKTLRALDPAFGKTEKDRRARATKRNELLKSMIKGNSIPEVGIYPGLGERWNRPKSEQIALTIPARFLQRVVEKVIKGLAFIEDGQLIDAQTSIVHEVVTEEGAGPIEELLEKFGELHARGPGIHVVRAVAPDDGISSVNKIIIWGELVLYASVLKSNA